MQSLLVPLLERLDEHRDTVFAIASDGHATVFSVERVRFWEHLIRAAGHLLRESQQLCSNNGPGPDLLCQLTSEL